MNYRLDIYQAGFLLQVIYKRSGTLQLCVVITFNQKKTRYGNDNMDNRSRTFGSPI